MTHVGEFRQTRDVLYKLRSAGQVSGVIGTYHDHGAETIAWPHRLHKPGIEPEIEPLALKGTGRARSVAHFIILDCCLS